ncbi:MAG: hypothetical protein ACYCVZ_07820 [Streptosporangiaceae bacterium]
MPGAVRPGAYCTAACERRTRLAALRDTITTGRLDATAPLPGVPPPPKPGGQRARRAVVTQITAALAAGQHLDPAALEAAVSSATPAERAAALRAIARHREQHARAAGYPPAPRTPDDD